MKWTDLPALVFHPVVHALLAIAGAVAAFMIWHLTYPGYAGTDGLVGGLLVASAILLASAAYRFDRST